MRKTKVICTIGPASENEEILTKMMEAGMNVARLNFSHGTHEEHQKKIDLIKRVREKMNLPIAIMLDTKGPEYRIRNFKNGSITLHEGDTFTFVTEEVEGDETRVSVNYKNLAKDLSVGDQITVNNGMVVFKVIELTVKCRRRECYFICGDIQGLIGFNDISIKAGDLAIIEALNRMEAAAGEGDVVFRIGADEFVIVTDSTDKTYANRLVEEILSHNGESFAYVDRALPLALYASAVLLEGTKLCYRDLFEKLHHTIMESKFKK